MNCELTKVVWRFGCHLSIAAGVLVCAASAAAQVMDIDDKAQETIDDCLEAMGSEMALSGVGGIEATGTINLDGDSRKFELKSIDGKLWLYFEAGEQLNICNGHYEWRMHKGEIRQDNDSSGIRHIFPYPGMALRWLENCQSVKHAGETEFAGRQAEELRFVPKGLGESFSRYFDKETDLLIGQKMSFDGDEMVLQFEYTEVEGVQIVSKIAIEQASFKQELKMENEIDTDIDVSIFEVPTAVKQGADSDDGEERRDDGKAKSRNKKRDR